MIGENGTPETPDWAPESRCCPFDRECRTCTATSDTPTLDMPDCWLGEN